MAKLPSPITIGDEYLAALLDEIKGLRADLALVRAPAVVNNGSVQLPPEKWPASHDPPAKGLLQRITGR